LLQHETIPELSRAAFVLTIHNLAYHGWTPAAQVPELGVPRAVLARGADGLDLLRNGIERADIVNTVSPGFAAEALTPEYGMGLERVLRGRGDRFLGILNGLDTDLWDPATDAALAASYSRENRAGKASCRTALLTELGLATGKGQPVLAMIGRLDRQKGFDLLAAAAPDLLERGIRLAVLGSGSPDVVAPLRLLAGTPEGRKGIALVERFDRDLARRMYAGADGFLMPSRFEPCGTGQMIALRYGTPPIVRATGGLRDTVVDVTSNPTAGTGFAFEGDSPAPLIDACDRFLELFRAGGEEWEGLLDRGMAVDFDWRSSSTPAYVDAYQRAVDVRARVHLADRPAIRYGARG
jgi:starch synthase